jgi:hypothetical protein
MRCQEIHHRHRRLLRMRRERPRGRRAAEQRDELPPFHSITSSARASSVEGTCVGRNPRTMLPPAPVKPDNFQAALAVFSSTFSTMTAVS